jgi:zinc/manganese transport system substrate-binding protein
MCSAGSSPPHGPLAAALAPGRRGAARRGARPRARACVAWMAVIALLSACSSPAAAPANDPGTDGITIVATTAIMGDIASNVVSDDDRVSVLMEAGADPHTFEPSARQIAELTEADLVIANGAGLEEGLTDALDEVAAAGVPVFAAADHVDSLPAEPDAHGHEHADGDADATTDDHAEGATDERADNDADDHGESSDDPVEHASEAADDHGDGPVDPHIWMDPARMADVVRALGEQIGAQTDAPQAAADRAQQYAAQLTDLDRRVDEMLADIPRERRTLVSNHASLSYFADRYDLEIVGTVIPGVSTGGEPSARDLEALAEVIRREEVPAIFTDSTAPSQLADTLARETGADVEIVELYTGSLGTDEATTYVDMLETDAERISQALRS